MVQAGPAAPLPKGVVSYPTKILRLANMVLRSEIVDAVCLSAQRKRSCG